MLTEIKRTEQDIEAQQIGEDKPHILRQPQVIGVDGLRQVIGRVIRRCHLVGGHTTKQGIGPTTALSGLLEILDSLLSGSPSCRSIMTVQDTSLDVSREEISKGQNGKQQHCQHVGQALL